MGRLVNVELRDELLQGRGIFAVHDAVHLEVVFLIDFLDMADTVEIDDGVQGILRITLKYDEKGKRVISGLRRISKPGLRIYSSKDELPKVLNGLGIALISTSKGIVTDKKARELGVGGEVLAYIW